MCKQNDKTRPRKSANLKSMVKKTQKTRQWLKYKVEEKLIESKTFMKSSQP